MSGGGEVFAGDFGEDSGCGPDADSGHARQHGLKRVRINHLLDLRRDIVTLLPQRRELRGQSRDHHGCRVRAGDHDRLLAECGNDLVRPVATFARCVFQHSRSDPFLAGGAHRGR